MSEARGRPARRTQPALARTGPFRLLAHPQGGPPGRFGAATAVAPGLRPLGLEEGRDGLLYVPAGFSADRPASLALVFHGAGGSARHGMGFFLDRADAGGVLLVAPESRRATWDVLTGGYGPDVAYADRAFERVFARCAAGTFLGGGGGLLGRRVPCPAADWSAGAGGNAPRDPFRDPSAGAQTDRERPPPAGSEFGRSWT